MHRDYQCTRVVIMQVPDATPAPSHHRQDVAINRSLSIRHMHHPVKAVRRATLVSAPEQCMH